MDLEEAIEQIFEFSRLVIYDDNKCSAIAEVRATKW